MNMDDLKRKAKDMMSDEKDKGKRTQYENDLKSPKDYFDERKKS